MNRIALAVLLAFLLSSSLAFAQTTTTTRAAATRPIDPQRLYERITPSLVAVQYIWENELSRQEINGAGIIVGDDGLVMTSLSLVDVPIRGTTLRIPDEQMKEFKIIVPSQKHEHDEIPATFQGRDDRN